MNFDEVYRLEEGECLKRIAQPFIPERNIFWRESKGNQQNPRNPPDLFMFPWQDGKLSACGCGWGKFQVGGLMDFILGMKTYEYDMPEELSSFEMDGDWIFARGAKPQDRLMALCDIVEKAGGPSFQFVQKDVPREIIVTTGEYVAHPLEKADRPECVHLQIGNVDFHASGGNGRGTFSEFLQVLGSHAKMAVIDEVQGNRPEHVYWRYHWSTNYKVLADLPAGNAKEKKINQLLEMVSKQTELRFIREIRMVQVWIAEPAGK